MKTTTAAATAAAAADQTRGAETPPKACQKSLAEFAARRRQRDSDHFLSGRTPGWSLLPLRGNSPPVPDRKYNSGCKCAICTPRAYKSCARQTAILLSKKGKALFRQSRILYVFLVFQTEEVGQKYGGHSQTQLCGVALNSLPRFSSFRRVA